MVTPEPSLELLELALFDLIAMHCEKRGQKFCGDDAETGDGRTRQAHHRSVGRQTRRGRRVEYVDSSSAFFNQSIASIHLFSLFIPFLSSFQEIGTVVTNCLKV